MLSSLNSLVNQDYNNLIKWHAHKSNSQAPGMPGTAWTPWELACASSCLSFVRPRIHCSAHQCCPRSALSRIVTRFHNNDNFITSGFDSNAQSCGAVHLWEAVRALFRSLELELKSVHQVQSAMNSETHWEAEQCSCKPRFQKADSSGEIGRLDKATKNWQPRQSQQTWRNEWTRLALQNDRHTPGARQAWDASNSFEQLPTWTPWSLARCVCSWCNMLLQHVFVVSVFAHCFAYLCCNKLLQCCLQVLAHASTLATSNRTSWQDALALFVTFVPTLTWPT